MEAGFILLILLAGLPLLYEIYHHKTIHIEKPNKKYYLHEDEEGNKVNPFSSINGEDNSKWDYPEDYFK